MPDDLEYTKKLLEIEYTQIRDRIEAIEDTRFKLKGRAVTLSSALLALGLNKGQRWVMLLSLLVACSLFLVEADYLLRRDALTRRGNEVEEVMESVRRHGQCAAVESYVFGMRAASTQGVSGMRFPGMFGRQSRAGLVYVLIAVTTTISMVAVR
jgi:hypothetical protein